MQGVIEIDLGEELRTPHAETDSRVFSSQLPNIYGLGIINAILSEFFVCLLVFRDKVSLYSLGCP